MSRLQQKPYSLEYAEMTRKLALLGHTDVQIAAIIGIKFGTFQRWVQTYPEMASSLAMGRDIADATVVESLYKRCNGYEHEAIAFFVDKGTRGDPDFRIHGERYTKHYPPDTSAIQFWLTNRKPDLWRNASHQTVDGAIEIGVSGISNLLALVRKEQAAVAAQPEPALLEGEVVPA